MVSNEPSGSEGTGSAAHLVQHELSGDQERRHELQEVENVRSAWFERVGNPEKRTGKTNDPGPESCEESDGSSLPRESSEAGQRATGSTFALVDLAGGKHDVNLPHHRSRAFLISYLGQECIGGLRKDGGGDTLFVASSLAN